MAIPRHRRRGKCSSVVQRHRLPACAAIRVKRHRVFVYRPERIERNSRVSRIECAKVIHLRPNVACRPPCLRVAIACKQLTSQRKCYILHLRRSLLRSDSVRAGLVHHRIRSRPERIKRDRRVRRISRAKVIHLRPAITGGPARLRIAVAHEQRNLQRQGDIVRLRRRLLRSAPVRPWLIHNRVCIRYPMRVVCHITRHNR